MASTLPRFLLLSQSWTLSSISAAVNKATDCWTLLATILVAWPSSAITRILSGMMVQTICRWRKTVNISRWTGAAIRHLRCSLRRPLRSALQPLCALTRWRRRSGSQLGQYQRRSDQEIHSSCSRKNSSGSSLAGQLIVSWSDRQMSVCAIALSRVP